MTQTITVDVNIRSQQNDEYCGLYGQETGGCFFLYAQLDGNGVPTCALFKESLLADTMGPMPCAACIAKTKENGK